MSLENDTQGGHSTRPIGGAAAPAQTNVLVNYPLEDEYIQRIEAVDPRIHLLRAMVRQKAEVGEHGDANWDDMSDWRDATESEMNGFLDRADVFCGTGFKAEWLDRAPNLKWVQLSSAGSENAQRGGVFDKRPNLLLTTASGVHSIPISEHILAMILHFSRGFNKAVRNQPLHKWERNWISEAAGSTVCIIGYGAIGRRAAQLCHSLEMKVISVRASLSKQQEGDGVAERFYPVSDLDNALAQADYVVVAAPRTPKSEKMIGREQFAVMKQNAVLINISRGATRS
jgi:phosphoglycerate dehydrogenase-like enzyme